MKQFLILLSSVTTLAISTTTFVDIKANTTFINNLLTNNYEDNQTTLFNNKYGFLSDSDMITNQSTIDHKFYSYDTSALANYTFSDAKSTFLVDNKGCLVYNSQVTIPDKEKVNLENTKQEMISHQMITTIKNQDNKYSKSEYSNSYFVNNDWQYIQFGGVEKHINISQQVAANKVENNNDLSETLGLYYIAKAVKENKITQAVANNLGNYFINQSSIKDNFNKDLTTKIIDLIVNNENIYNFIHTAPIKVIDKNYSLNFIFDNDNNLINIYYQNWNKDNIENNLNYYFSDSYSWWSSDHSNVYTLLKWTNYAKSWDDFLKIYPVFKFNQSSLTLSGDTQTHSESVTESFTNNINTNKILTDQGSGNTNSLYHLHIYMGHDISEYPVDGYANLDLDLWHDNENIYFKWFFTRSGDGTPNITIKLVSATFINIMN